MVIDYSQYDLRIWDPFYAESRPLTGVKSIQINATGGLGIDQATIILHSQHPMSARFQAAQHAPIPITWELNGVFWSGMVTEAVQNRDEWKLIVASDSKHFSRLQSRDPKDLSATKAIQKPVGELLSKLVQQAALRTGLPVYVQVEQGGPVVEVEPRAEDSIANLLGGFIDQSDVFVETRMLLPTQPVNKAVKITKCVGPLEQDWFQAMLDEGWWAERTDENVLQGPVMEPATTPQGMFIADSLFDENGVEREEPAGTIAWNPFDIVGTSAGPSYFDQGASRKNLVTRASTVEALTAQQSQDTIRWIGSFVTVWAPGQWAKHLDTVGRFEVAENGMLRKLDGTVFDEVTVQELGAYIGTGAAYAWREGGSWVIANQADFAAEVTRRKNLVTGPQTRTPGLLVRVHGVRDRRQVVFTAGHGGGLDDWQASVKAPDGLALISGVQHDQWRSMMMSQDGALSDEAKKGVVAKLDGRTVDVRPNATVVGSEVAFGSVTADADLAIVGPFAWRERYASLSGDGADLALSLDQAWAENMGGTALSLSPSWVEGSVFGNDVMRNGVQVPGWRVGDRITFVDGGTQVSDVVSGWSFQHEVGQAPKLTPVVGKQIYHWSPIDRLGAQIAELERSIRRGELAPPVRAPKSEVEAVVDERVTTGPFMELSEQAREWSEQAHEHSVAAAGFSDASLVASQDSLHYSELANQHSLDSLTYSGQSKEWSDKAAVDAQKAWDASVASSEASAASQGFSNDSKTYSDKSLLYSQQASGFSTVSVSHSALSLQWSEESRAHSEKSLEHSAKSQEHSDKSLQYSQQASDSSLAAKAASDAAAKSSQDANTYSLSAKTYSEQAASSASKVSADAAAAAKASADSLAASQAASKATSDSVAASQAASGFSTQAKAASDAALRSEELTAESLRLAEVARAAAEEQRRLAEEARTAAEQGRDDAEQKRAEAEQARARAFAAMSAATASMMVAEQARADAEEARRLAELARADAEAKRAAAEESRRLADLAGSAAESERSKAEGERALAEQARSKAETERGLAEAARKAAETARNEAEQKRAAAEEQRTLAETARSDAEKARDDAETRRRNAFAAMSAAHAAMSMAEQSRAQAEEQRRLAELARSDAEAKRAAAEEQRKLAEDARDEAEQKRAAADTARSQAVAAAEKTAADAKTVADQTAAYVAAESKVRDDLDQLQNNRIADISRQQQEMIDIKSRTAQVMMVTKAGASHPDAVVTPNSAGGYYVTIPNNANSMTQVEFYNIGGNGDRITKQTEDWWLPPSSQGWQVGFSATQYLRVTWANAKKLMHAVNRLMSSSTFTTLIPNRSTWTDVPNLVETVPSAAEDVQLLAQVVWYSPTTSATYGVRILVDGVVVAEKSQAHITASWGSNPRVQSVTWGTSSLKAGQVIKVQAYSDELDGDRRKVWSYYNSQNSCLSGSMVVSA